MDLQLATTDELISEIIGRHTFYGIIIKTDSEYKQGTGSSIKEHKVLFNSNISVVEVPKLLKFMVKKFKEGGVTDPESNRQQEIILKLAKEIYPYIEPVSKERIDGKWIFELWEPETKETLNVSLSKCETKLERVT